MARRRQAWPFFVLIVLAAGCRSQQDAPPAVAARGAAPGESLGTADPASNTAAAADAAILSVLRNLTYQGLEVAPGPVALVDGRWEGEPLAPGGAARPSVDLVRDFHALGDLDGDGEQDAVVLLGARGGGTGEFVHVAVVARRDGRWQNVATAVVGDRVQVRSVRLGSASVVLDVVQAGRDDAMCCPGDLVTRTWRLGPAGLAEAPPVPAGRLSLGTLTGTEWVLRSWARDEPAPDTPEVTLVVQGDRFTGRSGCNRYFAAATPGEAPGDVELGPVSGTKMACPEPASGVEARFLAQLAGVEKFGFVAGELALSYERDGAFGTMRFSGRAPREE